MHAPNKTSLFQSLLMMYPYFRSLVQGMIQGFDPCQMPVRCTQQNLTLSFFADDVPLHAPDKSLLFQSLLMMYPYFSSLVQGMIEGFDPCQMPFRCTQQNLTYTRQNLTLSVFADDVPLLQKPSARHDTRI